MTNPDDMPDWEYSLAFQSQYDPNVWHEPNPDDWSDLDEVFQWINDLIERGIKTPRKIVRRRMPGPVEDYKV